MAWATGSLRRAARGQRCGECGHAGLATPAPEFLPRVARAVAPGPARAGSRAPRGRRGSPRGARAIPGTRASASSPASSSSTYSSSRSKHSSQLTSGPRGPSSSIDHRSPPRASRSLRRASCKVLYSAPRVEPSRSASTSIGTPLSASATNTSRWCGRQLGARRRAGSRAAAPAARAARGPTARGRGSRGQRSSSIGTSRPCQARRRAFTPASSSANL